MQTVATPDGLVCSLLRPTKCRRKSAGKNICGPSGLPSSAPSPSSDVRVERRTAAQARSVLMATTLTVTLRGESRDLFLYDATLILAEVTGLARAKIVSLSLYYTGTSGGDFACLDRNATVAAGGTWQQLTSWRIATVEASRIVFGGG